MGFVAEKVQNRTHLNGFLEKNHSKVIEDQLVF